MKKELSPMPDNCQIEVFINRPIIITGDIYENKNPEKIDPASYNVELLLKSIINKNNYTENVKSYVTKCKKKNIDNKGVDENFLTSSHNINIISKEDQDFNNVFDFIKYSITLEDLFKYYDVKVSNKNILCPLPDHSEKNPSFRANHLLNLWYCHSCQSGGSIIDLVMKMEGCNKLEAAKKINEIFNLGITFNKKLEAKQKEDYILNLHTEKIKNQGAIIDNTSIDWISVEVNERTGKTKSKILCPILAKYLQDQSHFIFAKDDVFGGEKHFYYYEGSYKPITSKEFKGHIKKYIPLDLQSMGVLSEVYNLLTNDLNYYSFEDLNPENYINFKNGLLNLDTWQLEEHNPNILTTIQLNCNYDVNTKVKGNVWNKFMNDFCITEDIKHIYKQIIGLAISNFDCSIFKNAIFTVGKHDTGKSKLKQLCEYMLGKGNYNNVELGKLEENFGTANLFNKRLVGSSDMRFMKITELAIFKNITGGDNFNVSFKYEGDFTYKYKGLLWNVTNRLPTFSLDTDKEIYNRFVILKHDNVIKKEDQNKTLMIDLINELDYIVVDVLNSFKSVVENKKLDIPVSCEAERHIYKNENNISLNFAQNFCREIETDKTNECIETTILHAIFKEFCKSYNNGFVPKISEFKETLNSNGIATIKPSNGKYYYYPLHINSLCYQEFVYLIHPSLKERILKQLNCNENTIWDSLGKEE
jgi:P4 family phage/plasmid primase-like protien